MYRGISYSYCISDYRDNLYAQTFPDMFSKLLTLIKEYPSSFSAALKAPGKRRQTAARIEHEDVRQWISSVVPKLSSDIYTTATRVFWILNGLTDFPECRMCGNREKYKAKNVALHNGYHECCCRQCSNRYSEFNHRRVKNMSRRLTYEGKTFDSSWELAYYIWLSDCHIPFIYQPDIHFTYLDKNRISHTYYPDFLVNDQIVEIKGDQFYTDDKQTMQNIHDHSTDHIYDAKYHCMLDNHVQILTYIDVEKCIQHCQRKFGSDVADSQHWYKRFKRSNKDTI